MKAKLVAILKGLCPRVYLQGAAPIGLACPYVTYYPIGGRALNYVDDAIPDKANAAIQVSVWADDPTTADTLAAQIEDAIRTAPTIQGRPIAAAITTYEPDTKLCGSIQRFDIWASR